MYIAEAKKNRKAIANKITMEVLFKESQPKLPALSSHSESSVNTSSRSKTPDLTLSTSLVVGENTYIGSRKRGASQWQVRLESVCALDASNLTDADILEFMRALEYLHILMTMDGRWSSYHE